ncbi:MAG: cysteine peptidase family C39 domain-containing protein [Methylococcaceae bacterium]
MTDFKYSAKLSHILATHSFLLIAALIFVFYFPATHAREPVKSLLEIRRNRVIVQKWDLSCGAAALSTLLTYQLNKPVSEKEVAQALIKRKEYIEHPELINIKQGFSLLDLKRYVDGLGFEGIGFGKLTFANLIKYAPIMVPIKVKGYNHFVIFRGYLGNRVLLADPAWGNRTMLTKAFTDAWIDYPKFGKVGFVVVDPSNNNQPNQMAPVPEDFVFLR